jgi:hypothetical protein
MNKEALITLGVEEIGGHYLVSCAKFPLLQLQIEDVTEIAIEGQIFPLLKEMLEHKLGYEVDLRLLREYDEASEGDAGFTIPPHIIAQKAVLHLG